MSLSNDDSWNRNVNVGKFIADSVARLVHGKVGTAKSLFERVKKLFKSLRSNQTPHSFERSEFTSDLRNAVENALKNCDISDTITDALKLH